jgi:hypothetical protein
MKSFLEQIKNTKIKTNKNLDKNGQLKKAVNVMKNLPNTLDPRLFFEKGIKSSLKALEEAGSEFVTTHLSSKSISGRVTKIKNPIYEENILSDKSEAALLCNNLLLEDLGKNGKLTDGVKLIESGIDARRLKSVMRRIWKRHDIPQCCDHCGDNSVLPWMIPYKSLSEILHQVSSDLIPGAIYCSIHNWLKLCPNCIENYRKINTKLYSEGKYPKIINERLDEIAPELTKTKPYATEYGVHQKDTTLTFKEKKVEKTFSYKIKSYNHNKPAYTKVEIGTPEEFKIKNEELWKKFSK